MMKISKETIEILKNFATINPSMIFQPGTVQKTVSPQKTVLAKANIGESFGQEFAIYDLNQFIGSMTMFEDPELELGSESLTITSGDYRLDYRYAKTDLIQAPPAKDISLPSSDMSFTIEAIAMKFALRAAGVLGIPEMALVGRGGTAYLSAIDSRNQASHTFVHPVGSADVTYMMVFKLENLKLLDRDYEVVVSSKGISHFKSTTGDVEYWIATEQNSTFG
jgi:hypothetical protein